MSYIPGNPEANEAAAQAAAAEDKKHWAIIRQADRQRAEIDNEILRVFDVINRNPKDFDIEIKDDFTEGTPAQIGLLAAEVQYNFLAPSNGVQPSGRIPLVPDEKKHIKTALYRTNIYDRTKTGITEGARAYLLVSYPETRAGDPLLMVGKGIQRRIVSKDQVIKYGFRLETENEAQFRRAVTQSAA